jgi:putative transposase
MSNEYEQRKSTMLYGELYFWTATINGWKHLLADDTMKIEVVQSLQWLTARELVTLYAYVIMPNHIHLIWETNKPNGKEMPHQSFLKFTGHQFKKLLSDKYPAWLSEFKIEAVNKQYEFWQRDSLAFPLFSKSIINQKMDYVHLNPVSGKWQLAASSVDYRFSSAAFYNSGIDEFGILTHIGAVFDRNHSGK